MTSDELMAKYKKNVLQREVGSYPDRVVNKRKHL